MSHESDRKRPRPLQPRPQPEDAAPSSTTQTRPPPNMLRATAVQIPKRVVVSAACNPCRQRKVKCNAERPSCHTCTRTGQTCNYSTAPFESRASAQKRKYQEVEQRLAAYEDLQGILDSRPADSQPVIERLQSSKDVQKTLRDVKEGELLLQLSREHSGESAHLSSSASKHSQDELNEQRYLIRQLRTMSDADALRALHRLRATPSEFTASEALISAIDSGPGLIQLSNLSASQGSLPPTLSSIEFELLLLHPNAYPPIEPFKPGAINVDDWFRPLKRTSDTPFTSQGSHDIPPMQGNLVGDGHELSQVSTSRGNVSKEQVSPTRRLLGDWQLCDPRLSTPNMQYWTKVPISNNLASHVLSHFFTIHYPIFVCFDAELFIEDLSHNRTNHCSTLLVAGIMSIACQSFSTFDTRCSRLALLFEQEGEQHWRAVQGTIGPKELAAMCYLAMASGMSGHESLAFSLLIDIRETAKKLGLFGVQPTNEFVEQLYQLPPSEFQALAAAAWGAYNWLTFHALYYPAPPLDHPPFLPIPGDSVRRSCDRIWPNQPLPGYVGQTFTHLCRLWILSEEMRDVYLLGTFAPRDQRYSLSSTELCYQRLLDWSDNLTLPMQRDEQSASHLYFFHAIYHIIVLRLFHPFLNRRDGQHLTIFKSEDAKPAMIYAASMKQMKRILVLYSIKCGKNSDNGWFMAAVLQVTGEMLRALSDPDWRIYLQLCFNFWREAYIRYRVYLKVAEANLSFALQLKAIRSKTAVAMMAEIRSVGSHHEAPEQAFLTAVIDYKKASEDIASSKMNVMANEFASLTVEHTEHEELHS